MDFLTIVLIAIAVLTVGFAVKQNSKVKELEAKAIDRIDDIDSKNQLIKDLERKVETLQTEAKEQAKANADMVGELTGYRRNDIIQLEVVSVANKLFMTVNKKEERHQVLILRNALLANIDVERELTIVGLKRSDIDRRLNNYDAYPSDILGVIEDIKED